jgi:hypothetical protein
VPNGVRQGFVDHQQGRAVQSRRHQLVGIGAQRHGDAPLALDAPTQIAERCGIARRRASAQLLNHLPQFLLLVRQAALQNPQLLGDVSGRRLCLRGRRGDIEATGGQRLKHAIMQVATHPQPLFGDSGGARPLRQVPVLDRRTDVRRNDLGQQPVVGGHVPGRSVEHQQPALV